ncbi:MAG: YdcH family protein [Deltaproteobacteria bacterium]|nr:YdcH family protein [Deltaproteobacteria bacterium]MBW2120308.1 YdcH family protein [Deltaproteobacteria bacterium]
MGEKEETLVSRLIRENQAFRTMKERHAELEDRLERLETKPFLAPQEELEVKKIKKRKLMLKDEMQRILASHQEDG